MSTNPVTDVLDVGEDGPEGLTQHVPESRALPLLVEDVKSLQHPVLGVRHLDGLGGSEHLSDEPGHASGRLPALLPVALDPPAHHVDYDQRYHLGKKTPNVISASYAP